MATSAPAQPPTEPSGGLEEAMTPCSWDRGRWLNEPLSAREEGADLLVTAREGSDLWRETAYGFVHDDGHALLAELPVGRAMEVAFVAELPGRYDQAGVLVRAGEGLWVKAGIERSDGQLQLGAVVTREVSDWSLHPVPAFDGAEVTIRVSRGPDSLTVRARRGGGAFQLVRLAPFSTSGLVEAGPMCCAPSRAGLCCRFTAWRCGPADRALHAD